MTLEWTRPEYYGRGDITAYVIKYGDESFKYTNANYATVKVFGDTTNYTFTDQLEELTNYHFNVVPENTAGRGEFSEFSDYVNTWRGKQCHD